MPTPLCAGSLATRLTSLKLTKQFAALSAMEIEPAKSLRGVRALAKKAPPKMDWLDLNEAIGEVVAMARSEVQRNRVLLQTRLANDLPLISGDKIQLQQVILKSADKRYGSHEWSG